MVDRLQARGGSDRGMDAASSSARDRRLEELEEDRRRLVEENRQLRERSVSQVRHAHPQRSLTRTHTHTGSGPIPP